MENKSVRINFDFPREEYARLKMICAREGISMRGFISELIRKALEELE